MTRYLARTLAVRFAATLAAGLILAAAASYYATARALHARVDETLGNAAFLWSLELQSDSTLLTLLPPVAFDPSAYAQTVNRYAVLRDGAGHVVRALPVFASDLPLDSTALTQASAGAYVYRSATWRGTPMRILYAPIQNTGVPDGRVVEIGMSVAGNRLWRREMLVFLVAVVVVGSAATLYGAWRLTGNAVRPVGEITTQATRIEAGTLGQRIEAHAETEEYRGLVAVLNRMLDRLDRAFRVQRRFNADVGHELRTPLTALQGEIEIALRAERSAPEYRRVLESALEETERLSDLVERLLWLTRAESGLITPSPAVVDAGDLIHDAVVRQRRRLEARGLHVEEANRVPEAARLDAALVGRMLDELLANAATHARDGGTIAISADAVNGTVRFAVEDDGPGISAENLPHVFDPFFRADQARTRDTGVGLGLSVVAAAARAHGGAARAVNRNGSGARFEVELPQVAAG